MTNKTIDLNIFYREIYTEEADWKEESDWYAERGTTWSPTLTIDPYIYVEDARGIRKYEAGLSLIECTPEETAEIAKHYPQDEYGSDWWDFAENFLAFAPPRIASLIKTINVEEHALEPNWWIAMAEDILI